MHPQAKAIDCGGDCLIRLDAASLHDLVSPVNQMCAMTDLIRKKYGSAFDSEAGVVFGFLQDATQRMRVLVAGLSEYARVVGSPEEMCSSDSGKLLSSALKSQRQAIERTGAVITKDPLPRVHCDPGQVVFTFACLIGNAIRFRGEAAPRIHIGASPAGEQWRFSVADNGMGIEPNSIGKVFHVFWGASRSGGAGMGLAIARQVVERHGGRIWVESEAGKGSTFFFELPQCPLSPNDA